MRYFLTIILGFFILFPAQSGAIEVRIGIDNNPPLTAITADGKATGLLPDLLTQIAKQEKWSIEIVPCQWQQCLEQLEAGTIDILPAIAYTEQRAKICCFANESVITNWGQVYQYPGSKLESVLQLENLDLAVLKDDIHYRGEYGIINLANKFGIKINFVEADSYLDVFTLLAEKKVDAALVNRLFGLKQQEKFNLQPTQILLNPIQVRPAFSLTSDPLLVKQFDRRLKDWKEDQNSVYYQLLHKWLTNGPSFKFPGWFIPLVSVLGFLLFLSILTTFWIRRQVALKTVLLKEKNIQLEDELTARHNAEQTLEERNQFLQSVIDGVSDPLMVIGLDYQILQMNRAAQKEQNNDMNEQDTLTCHQHSHASLVPCNADDHPCPLLEVKETGEPVTMIHHHETDQGKRIVELTASPLFDGNNEIYAIIEVARDITDRLQIEELLNENEKRLHHLAHHDSLTNLPNRLLFEDRLKQALSKARRSRRQVALFFLDLDHLKAVNDNLGHDYGDLLLIDIAKRLRKCVRESDTVARMGGDEFLILLEEIESIEMIEVMAERVCNALTHELSKGDFSQMISASIGISIYPEDATNALEMMKNADLAMYRVKNSGKANYQFYSAPQGRFLFD
ncbi:MAG: diguanylate cyclase [Desulfuromusa sp.]|nr:diguanylate cyclase [Desulfuromusa sp.]